VSARAIWQGMLKIQKHEIAVKLYSAVVDRQIHFHLLHKHDRTRVEQHMVDTDTQATVPLSEARKAFEAEPGLYVEVTHEEIERTLPKPARKITVSRCVRTDAINPQFFDHPYFLGPGDDSITAYFALAQALERKKSAGVCLWTMRKHSYVGALIHKQGYLMLITLRHNDEVIPVSELAPPQGRVLEPKEKELAGKLIETLSGQFDPSAYHDGYQERIRELIDAKRTGKKIKRKRMPRRRSEGTLADSLQASLKSAAASRHG
jgi:DNA end-binding protein Ku